MVSIWLGFGWAKGEVPHGQQKRQAMALPPTGLVVWVGK